MNKKEIILIGGGGHCKSCIDVIEQEGKYDIAGIVDLKEKLGQKVLDYPVFASDEDLPHLVNKFGFFHITIGQIRSADVRIHLFNKLIQLGTNLPVIISPLAYVSKHAQIGNGTIIMHNAVVNSGACIGKNCIINTKALVEHDAIIGDYCHISTGAIVNGGVEIGERSFFGSGAVSKQYIKIPDNSFIKANSLVV